MLLGVDAPASLVRLQGKETLVCEGVHELIAGQAASLSREVTGGLLVYAPVAATKECLGVLA